MPSLPPKYWSEVKPTIRFLKEAFQTLNRKEMEASIGKIIDRKEIDPFMINEAGQS